MSRSQKRMRGKCPSCRGWCLWVVRRAPYPRLSLVECRDCGYRWESGAWYVQNLADAGDLDLVNKILSQEVLK